MKLNSLKVKKISDSSMMKKKLLFSQKEKEKLTLIHGGNTFGKHHCLMQFCLPFMKSLRQL